MELLIKYVDCFLPEKIAMPYDPLTPDEKERSNAYLLVWIGLFTSLLSLLDFALPKVISDACLMSSAILFFIILISPRFDEYFIKLRAESARWALAIIASWFGAYALIIFGNHAQGSGFALASGELINTKEQYNALDILPPLYFLCKLSTVIFFAKFAMTKLRS